MVLLREQKTLENQLKRIHVDPSKTSKYEWGMAILFSMSLPFFVLREFWTQKLVLNSSLGCLRPK
jgi:hypothetical protein